MKSNTKPSIRAEICLDHIWTVFLPNLAELRTLHTFAEEISVLLMNNRSSHITNDVIELLIKARVRIITFAPDPMQIFQVLNIDVFGFLTRHSRYELPFGDEKATIEFIMKAYRDLKQTIVEPSI
jgi:hypothetical protein